MKLKTLLTLIFCGELKYLSRTWAEHSDNNGHPIENALLVKIWGLFYLVVAMTAMLSPTILANYIFPPKEEGFRPLMEYIPIAYATIVLFVSSIAFGEFWHKQRKDWSIFTKTHKFTDAILTLLKAILYDSEATQSNIRHLARAYGSGSSPHEKFVFPKHIITSLYRRMMEIAEAVKEFELLSPQEKEVGSFNCTQDKASLKKLFETCQGFGLFQELTLDEIYGIAKQKVLDRKKQKQKQEEEELQKDASAS
jgi:hypothetical protein